MLLEIFKSEINQRKKDSIFGYLFPFVPNLLTFSLFYFVFAFVLKSRWQISDGSEISYEVMLLSGLIFFFFISQSLFDSTFILQSKKHLLKKIALDPLIFINVSYAISTIIFLVNVVLVVLISFVEVSFDINIALQIFFLCAVFMITVYWISLLVIVISVIISDTRVFIAPIVQGLMFFSPVLYNTQNLPIIIQESLKFNPLTIPVQTFRSVLFQQEYSLFKDVNFITFSVSSFLFAILVIIFFNKIRYRLLGAL